jgi:hypothetical protein
MATETYHVILQIGGGWSVRKAGAARANRTFDKKDDAIRHARDTARKSGRELVIHARNGTIRERTTYGNDPKPPRDSKR